MIRPLWCFLSLRIKARFNSKSIRLKWDRIRWRMLNSRSSKLSEQSDAPSKLSYERLDMSICHEYERIWDFDGNFVTRPISRATHSSIYKTIYKRKVGNLRVHRCHEDQCFWKLFHMNMKNFVRSIACSLLASMYLSRLVLEDDLYTLYFKRYKLFMDNLRNYTKTITIYILWRQLT